MTLLEAILEYSEINNARSRIVFLYYPTQRNWRITIVTQQVVQSIEHRHVRNSVRSRLLVVNADFKVRVPLEWKEIEAIEHASTKVSVRVSSGYHLPASPLISALALFLPWFAQFARALSKRATLPCLRGLLLCIRLICWPDLVRFLVLWRVRAEEK